MARDAARGGGRDADVAASDARMDSLADLPEEPDSGRIADASIDAGVDAGQQDAGTLTPSEELLAAIPRCSPSQQCRGGVSCPDEDGNGICVDLEETTLYPGPCAIWARGYPPDFEPGVRLYAYEICLYAYENGKLRLMDHHGQDCGGDGQWGGENYEYDASGALSRFDYWQTQFVSAACNVGSMLYGGGSVVHLHPVDSGEFCNGQPNGRPNVQNHDSDSRATFELAGFDRLALRGCLPHPWWRPVGVLTEVAVRETNPLGDWTAKACTRMQLSATRTLDYCPQPASQDPVLTRETLHDDAGRVLSQDDVEYDDAGAVDRIRHLEFMYDGTRIVEVVERYDAWAARTYTYHYDPAGNIVYHTRDDAYLDYSAIYDYSCWR